MWSPFAVGRIHPVLVVCGEQEKEKCYVTHRGTIESIALRIKTESSAALIRSMRVFIVYRLDRPLPVARGASLQERERETVHSHFSGGVMVMDCAVNSSSKYLVSVSDETCGMNGGTSWTERSLLYTIMYKLNVLEQTYTMRLVVFKRSIFCSSRQHLCDQNTVKPGILLNTIYTYSGYGKYSDPLKFFTLLYCSHLLKII